MQRSIAQLVPVALVALVLLPGCVNQEQAQKDAAALSLATRSQVIRLRQEVRQKIAAEERFYQKSVDTLRAARERQQYVELMEAILAQAEQEAARLISRPADVTPERIAETLRSRSIAWAETREAGRVAIQLEQNEVNATIARLNALNEQYMALEQTLTRLSIPPDRRAEAQRTASFIVDVAERLRELETKRRDAAQEAEDGPADEPDGG